MGRRSEDRKKRGSDENKVLRFLSSLKYVALSSGVDPKSLQTYLKENTENFRRGQKRYVFDHPESKDSIIKLGFTYDGILDNINDILSYNRLLDLVEDGELDKEDLDLFAKIELHNNDPMMIQEEKFTTYREYQPFLDWYDENKNKYQDSNKSELWAIYVSDNENFKEDHNRILEIIKNHFVGSDCLITDEPDNFGVRETKSGDNLVLYDMGSVVPLFKEKRNLLRPICKCGGELYYYNFKLSKNKTLELSASASLKGMYGCDNDDCEYSFNNIEIGRTRTAVKDAKVFQDYLNTHRDLYARDQAEIANFYMPSSYITSYNKYIDDYEEYFEPKTDEDYRIMYKNYLALSVGQIYDIMASDIDELLEEAKEDELTFEEFEDRFEDLLDDYDEEADTFTDLLCIITFLQSVEKYDGALSLEVISDLEDRKSFERLLDENSEIELTNDEISDMWSILKDIID